MKKWLTFSLAICLVITILATAFAYHVVRSPINEGFQKARSFSYDIGMNEIAAIDYYFGTEAYYVVEGLDENGEEAILWIREDFSFYDLARKADGITREEALSILEREEQFETVKSIKLGYERGLPIYEIVYETLDERLGYYYVTFTDGTFMKKYVLRKEGIFF